MKQNHRVIVAISIAVLVFPLHVGCQEQVKAPPQPVAGTQKKQSSAESVEAAPRITFDEVVHDFGQVGPGTFNKCEFKFKNTGEGILKIGKIQSTCGCTVPKLEKKDYASGEDGVIKVKYHAAQRPGTAQKLLYVKSNDKTNSRVKLTINADITRMVDYEPKKLKLSLIKENAACPQVKITSLDGKPFSIRDFKSSAGSMTVDYDPTAKATEFVVQPKVDMEKLKQQMKGQIDFALTHPSCEKVVIPFDTLTRFKINPASLIVFNANPSEPMKKQLWVLSNYDEDFRIESTSSKNGTVKVMTREKLSNRYKLELQITPPPMQGNKKMFTDTFSVNIKGGPELKVACRGFYKRDKK